MVNARTARLARELWGSVTDSPGQTATALGALAAIGCLNPMGALAAAACGAALLAGHFRSRRLDALGRTPDQAKSVREEFHVTLGTEAGTGRPVTLTGTDVRQHMLVLGGERTANTDFYVAMAEQAVAAGSGAMLVSGMGDVALFAKTYMMARKHGRLDDLLVLNLMTGNAGVAGGGGRLLSNTINPLATGNADDLTQLIADMIDPVGGDGAMMKGRATAMLSGALGALTWLRDREGLELDLSVLRDHLALEALVGLSTGASAPGLPDKIKLLLKNYLSSIPGFNPDRGPSQAQTTREQHVYVECIIGGVISGLADVYGHILKTSYGEIDMRDVVLNRRILVVMLPQLEMSGDEIANLGKIVAAMLKGMMGNALGDKIKGDWRSIVENRVTNSPSPFLCVLDGVGYYAVPGLALMAAQARSMGFWMIYGSQDIPALKRINEREGESIISNTATKVFMRRDGTEDIPYSMAYGKACPPGVSERVSEPRGASLFNDDAGALVMYKASRVNMVPTRFSVGQLPAGSKFRARIRANWFTPLPTKPASAGDVR